MSGGGPALRVGVLGPMSIPAGDVPLRVDPRKALAVLALAAVGLSEGSPVLGRDQLAAMLWLEVDEQRARETLRHQRNRSR